MPGILREDEKQLPRGVTTVTGGYTAQSHDSRL